MAQSLEEVARQRAGYPHLRAKLGVAAFAEFEAHVRADCAGVLEAMRAAKDAENIDTRQKPADKGHDQGAKR